MARYLPRILGIAIVGLFVAIFFRFWFFPTPPDALFLKSDERVLVEMEDKDVVVDDFLDDGQELDNGQEKGQDEIVLSSLQAMESQQGAPVPALLGGNHRAEETRQNESSKGSNQESGAGQQLPAPPDLRLESLNQAPVRGPSVSSAEQKQVETQAMKAGLWLQAGAFSSRDNALNLQRQLREQGFPTDVEQVNISGQSFHRVYVGPIAEAQLDQVTRRLQAMNLQARQVRR